jgi:hypothetical protein
MYLLHLYERDEVFPEIDKQFIDMIMRVICERRTIGGRKNKSDTQDMLEELRKFNVNVYKNCVNENEIMYSDNIRQVLAYECTDIVKNLENNISEHYVQYISKFVNAKFDVYKKREIIDKLEVSVAVKKAEKKKIYRMFKNVVDDMLNTRNEKKSDMMFHKFIDEFKNLITPNKKKYLKDSIVYDVCAKPFDYLKCMIYMNRCIEDIDNETGNLKLFNVIPLRTSIVPKNITLDTAALVRVFIRENLNEYCTNIEANKDKVWNKYFNMKRKEFTKNNYKFNYSIKTDGISVSLLFTKLDATGKPVNIYKQSSTKQVVTEKYIEDVQDFARLKDKKIITIDPGKSDIIHCISDAANDSGHKIKEHFRYTQAQRRAETRLGKYKKIYTKIKSESGPMSNGLTIQANETQLSKHNSRTNYFEKFRDYVKEKNRINSILYKHYTRNLYRKLKLNIYINKQRSEAKMVNNFKAKFGNPDKCVVVMGDYDGKHIKGKEPVICKRIRILLRRNKFETYMINEYNTSKTCNACGKEVEQFHTRKSKNPKHNGENILVWGLVRCQNTSCELIHNRDTNACKNMLKITKSIFSGQGRPKIYCPKPQLQSKKRLE